jgi:ubiquinone/menaquinone biosynthesis C-methylase UbiE
MFKKLNVCALFFLSVVTKEAYPVEDYEIWWQNCLENHVSYATFEGWIGDIHSSSRVAMRRHVKYRGYKSILDVPSGLCIDYFGFKYDGMTIAYQGVDITPRLVELAQNKSLPVVLGDIKSLLFKDNQFDICYARHILEHLNSYEQALTSLIRVAKYEVLVVFFIPPQETPNIKSDYNNGYLLYHNTYCRQEMERFILANPKVSKIEWEPISQWETILHIYIVNK